MRIAGIGSRETPISIQAEMTRIGEWCRYKKIYVTSGHADGADYAFEQGAQEYCLVYLPWNNFNNKLPILGKSVVPPITERLMQLVYDHHPRGRSLSPSAQNLMARNGCQVLGMNLDKPVSAVVCWRIKAGGTDQAIRIAVVEGIPVFNMSLLQFNTAEKVIERLKGLM